MSGIPITLQLINQAFASFLKSQFPSCKVYDNPNQQGTETPCWFITIMPSVKLKRELGRHYLREIAYDLVYEDDYNLPDLMDRYTAAGEKIDEELHMLLYSWTDTSGEYPVTYQTLLHIKEREWTVGLDAMHYKLVLNVRVLRQAGEQVKMQFIEGLQETVKDNGGVGNLISRDNAEGDLYAIQGVSEAAIYELM